MLLPPSLRFFSRRKAQGPNPRTAPGVNSPVPTKGDSDLPRVWLSHTQRRKPSLFSPGAYLHCIYMLRLYRKC